MRELLHLLRKDFLNDYRDPLGVSVQGAFSLTAGVAMGLAFRGSVWPGEALLLAGLPLTLVFLAIYAVHTGFVREGETGTLDGLRLAPVGAEIVFMSKTIYSFVIILFFSIVYLAAASFFMGGLPLKAGLVLSWLLPTAGFLGIVSSMASAMMVYSGARSTLGPAIVLVLAAPYFSASLPPLSTILQGASPLPGWEASLYALTGGVLVLGLGLSKFLVE